MYEAFFGFNESPFSIAPDPRYLYMSERHQEALAHLLYGLEREGGFILLTGEVGTGKTTICRKFLQNIPENTDLAFVLYPKLSAMELLATICDELAIVRADDVTVKSLIDLIYKHLLAAHAQGRHTALIIDEAQNLTTEVLEQLRLLTNLETDKKKLLQIILLGQPELNELLNRQELRQLSQRVTARYHLEPLSAAEVDAYIAFRLGVAGCKRSVFGKSQIRRIHKSSRGIPRLINLICDRALLGAYSSGEQEINSQVVRQAVKEVLGPPVKTKGWHLPRLVLSSGLLLTLLGLSIAYFVTADKLFQTTVHSDGLMAMFKNFSDPAKSVDSGKADDEKEETDTEKSEADRNRHLAKISSTSEVSAYAPFEEYKQQKDNIGNAYSSLLRQWKIAKEIAFNNEAESCNWAAQRGLECLHRRGNWRSLLQLNRPAVLALMNDQGVRFRATLTDVSEDQVATLELDGQQHKVPLTGLDRYWYGQYSLVWKVPSYKSRFISPGTIQDRTEWLHAQFDLRDSLLENNASQAKAAELRVRVKRFQREVGIQPDGIAGTITIIMLNSWTQPNIPLLFAKDKPNALARDKS